MKNICDNYFQKGFFFEQYHSIDGHGRRAHPFNGWTSLISLIIND